MNYVYIFLLGLSYTAARALVIFHSARAGIKIYPATLEGSRGLSDSCIGLDDQRLWSEAESQITKRSQKDLCLQRFF